MYFFLYLVHEKATIVIAIFAIYFVLSIILIIIIGSYSMVYC